MPINTKFTPSQYQDRDDFNESVLNERYATVKALRESYSNLYQEFTNLRNNLQDYKGEQANQPDILLTSEDKNRYNNEIENRFLAINSIKLNTRYPNEYGHMVKPFDSNATAANQIRLNLSYMISGDQHFKNYHLAKTSHIAVDLSVAAATQNDEANANTDTVDLTARSFYINALDATDAAAVFGNGTQTITYTDQYGSPTPLQGHIFLLETETDMDGKYAQSILGRNVQNCESIMEILAMNVNATEQALDRIVEISALLGVEVKTN